MNDAWTVPYATHFLRGPRRRDPRRRAALARQDVDERCIRRRFRRPAPPAAPRPVDFDKDVKPILASHCANCHGGGKSKGDFRIDTRTDFIKGGGNDQPAAVPNDSAKSR